MDVVSADPYLNSLLVQYFDDVLASRHVRSSPWRLKVENAVAPLLPHGQAQIGEIARQLGVSRRTLSRRLAAEGNRLVKYLIAYVSSSQSGICTNKICLFLKSPGC